MTADPVARMAPRLLTGLLLACVFALGVTKIEDTDAWTHLALGRSIVQDRGFPATEPFSYPGAALPYHNQEWLFGLVLYLVQAAAGLAGVILLKAAIATLAFWILLKHCLLPRDPPAREVLAASLACVVMVPTLLVVRHRFVERPDLVLMVFLAFTIYALDAYVHEGRRYLYALPALQVIWVNMHPSIVVGAVPFVAILAGGTLQAAARRYWSLDVPGTPSPRQLRVVAAVFAAVILASLLNPYGLDAFVAPFKFGGATWYLHEISELQAPRLGQQSAPFVIAALLSLAFALTVKRLSIVSLLLVLPFAYLAFSARRFIFLFAVVSAPVLARHLRALTARLGEAWARRLTLPTAVAAAVLGLAVIGLWATRTGPLADALKEPGFGINSVMIPDGALRYLERVGAFGRVFNVFHWGGYIAWRDFPRLAPFTDGRGHVPAGLLDEAMVVRENPVRLEKLRSTYGFEIAIVDYPVLPSGLGSDATDIDLGWNSPPWALVYWDDLTLVYVHRAGQLAAIAQRDEYRHVRPAIGALHLRRRLQAGVPSVEIEAELKRNVADTGSSMGLVLLGFLYNDGGRHAEAIQVLGRVRDFPGPWSQLANVYQGLAFAHARLAQPARALEYYTKAAAIDETADVLYNIGVLAAKAGDDRRAIHSLERALERNPNLLAAYPVLLAAYRRAGRADRAERLEATLPRALAQGKAEEHFHRGVQLYREGRHHEAIAAFGLSLQLNPRSPAVLSNLGYVYFDLGRLDEAMAQQQRALEADPAFANAHYGLALIHERRGQTSRARAHFAEYLRLDPRGYWSRRARQALDGAPRS